MALRFSRETHEAAVLDQTGMLDPGKVDVAERPPQARKPRDRPEPAEDLRKWEAGAEKRLLARPYPPNLILEPAGMNEEHWTSPHSDTSLWNLQLAEAFGTRSQAVISTFFSQIEQLCQDTWWDEQAQQWRISEVQFSAVLAIVNSVKPRNEIEAMLASQMVAVHLMQMKVSARAIKHEHEAQTVAAASKLARTFTMQLQELRALKGRSRTTRQNIKVTKETHQHVHYHDDRGAGENADRPHARMGIRNATAPETADERAPLPSQDKGGEVVSLPVRSRQTRVSDARR